MNQRCFVPRSVIVKATMRPLDGAADERGFGLPAVLGGGPQCPVWPVGYVGDASLAGSPVVAAIDRRRRGFRLAVAQRARGPDIVLGEVDR